MGCPPSFSQIITKISYNSRIGLDCNPIFELIDLTQPRKISTHKPNQIFGFQKIQPVLDDESLTSTNLGNDYEFRSEEY